MKKVLFSLLLIGAAQFTFAQSAALQASLTTGTTLNSVRVKVKSKNSATTGIISTVNFCIQLSSTVTPKPTLTVSELLPLTGVGTYTVTDASAETPGFYTWNIDGTDGSTATTWTSNEEKEFIEIVFGGGPKNTTSSIRLVHIPDGGTTGTSTFYLSIGGTPQIIENELLYGAGVINNTAGLYPGGNAEFSLNGITLPITWIDFSAIRKNNDANITWRVANEESNDHFELERSTNGVQFTKIATQQKIMMGKQVNDYSFFDKNIDQLNSKVIYYRLKQVDKDSKTTYSDIRSIRISNDIKEVGIYPNPANNGFYVTVPFGFLRTDSKLRLNLVNRIGQTVHAREIAAAQSSNYYYDIKTPGIITGEYMLQIIQEGKVVDTKKVIVQH